MTQYEMAEQIARKCDVTLDEAMTALEAGGWNALTATHLLEQEKFRKMQALNEFAEGGEAAAVQAAPEEPAQEAAVEADKLPENVVVMPRPESAEKQRARGKGLKSVFSAIRRVVACGNRNRFTVRKGDEKVLEMPVTALALLALCAFWVCVPLLVIGLFAGCRYSFSGKELGREGLNRALDKAADAAGSVRKTVAQA